MSFPASIEKEICLNFYIVTKKTTDNVEPGDFKIQKKLVLNQMSQAQLVFEKNQQRHCPEINFSKGIIKHITWDEALKLSQPVDQDTGESSESYLYRKLKEASDELQLIIQKLNTKPNIKYNSFMDLRPGSAIIKAEKALKRFKTHRENMKDEALKNIEDIELTIASATEQIKAKLDAYGQKSSVEILSQTEKRISNYEEIDRSSALTWSEGELTFWNDIEAQNTSIELKNLLKLYRTPTNQCLDVYVIPSGKTPSSNVAEVQKNGKWTKRDGVAISSKNFPRTTAGKGDAIILTHHSKKSEFRLAHEFGHLLLDVNNAHLDKEEKDLMYEYSKGGFYLDEIECDKMRENINSFFTGAIDRNSGY
jgi:hypothetical protein